MVIYLGILHEFVNFVDFIKILLFFEAYQNQDKLFFTLKVTKLSVHYGKRVVEFSSRGYKIRIFLPKNQHTQRKWLNFEIWCGGKVHQKVPKFSMSKIIRFFLIYLFIFSLKNTNLEAHFTLLIFFDSINFSITLLLK